MQPYTILVELNLSYTSYSVNRQIGVSDFKYVEKRCPYTHGSRDTAHARWLQTPCQWYPMEKSELITQEAIAVGSSMLVVGLNM